MKEFNVKSCEEIMSTVYKPLEFVVENMIAQGLYILAGAPKVGKSWLALDVCLSVANGEKVLGMNSTQGTALYLCLEDSYQRIQNRLYDITDEPSDNLFFSVVANSIGKGLEEQIENFKSQNQSLAIVFIDTLQKVREESDSSYGSDYKELSALKTLADKLEIAIVLVHHTRKCFDADPFNMISGSTGLSGCVDGSMVLVENKRGSRVAKLYCVGRDVENLELNLVFRDCKWVVTDEVETKEKDIFPFAVHDFMIEQKYFKGSATELAELLKNRFGTEFHSNIITKKLVQHGVELETLGVKFKSARSHGKRFLELVYSVSGDSSDGKILWAETVDHAGTHETANPLSALFEQGDGSTSDDQSGDGKIIDIQFSE